MNNTEHTYWTAFYTKPRSEKVAASRLSGRGFEIYCPTQTVIKSWSDRKKKIQEPVFTSYIFAKVNETTRQQILMDPSIVSSVFWLQKPVKIKDEEINGIRSFLEEVPEGANITSFSRGDAANVMTGPFRGQIGQVIRIRGGRAVLQLQSLGIELRAEISLNKLGPVA